MDYRVLGNTGIRVSRLCFGSLTVGPLQANLPIEEGASVIAHAISRGVNFIDTAQYYNNYAYIRRALELVPGFDTVISTKSYAYDKRGAHEALEQARRELNRDVIDIFMLHEQESIHTLRGHLEALDYYLEMKSKGVIRAVGVSTHHIAAVEGALEISGAIGEYGLERDIGVVFPIFNIRGLGIADGGRDEMLAAVSRAHSDGMGTMAMKALGGGNFYGNAAEALEYVISRNEFDSVALGIQSIDEADADIEFFEKRVFSPESEERLKKKKRSLHIEEYCEGCGACVARCGQGALSLVDGHSVLDADKCVLCGYCAGACPLFAIKVL